MNCLKVQCWFFLLPVSYRWAQIRTLFMFNSLCYHFYVRGSMERQACRLNHSTSLRQSSSILNFHLSFIGCSLHLLGVNLVRCQVRAHSWNGVNRGKKQVPSLLSNTLFCHFFLSLLCLSAVSTSISLPLRCNLVPRSLIPWLGEAAAEWMEMIPIVRR